MKSAMSSNREIVTDAFRSWANGTGYVASIFADDMTWEITGRSAASKKYANTQQFTDECLHPFGARRQDHRRHGLLRQHRVQRTLGRRQTLTRANDRRGESVRRLTRKMRQTSSHTGEQGPELRIRGALGGTRTPNLLIRSQMLYPLSYERRCAAQSTALRAGSALSRRELRDRQPVKGHQELPA